MGGVPCEPPASNISLSGGCVHQERKGRIKFSLMAAYNTTGGRGVKKDTPLPVAMWYIKDWGGGG